ncbi:MAG: LppM family (lipo)protein [Actinomycetota bacterium]
MLGGSRRFRVFATVVALVLTCAACEINVELVTTVNDDGSGRFSLRFEIDKELVDLARNSGEDPFTALACPAELETQGWECGRSTEGGGLTISLDRAFRNPDELNGAMAELERIAAEQEGPTAQFFTLRVEREAGFLKSRTAVEGSVDLTATGVLGNASEESRDTLEAIITQAAGEFFRFRLRVELPGSVSSTTGDPEQVEGGVVTWRPRLGRTLTFRAESSAFNVGSLALIGGPALALLALLLWTLVRRGRRSRSADGLDAQVSE